MKLPIPRNPIQSSKNNITYHTLQKFDFTELIRWILDLREELLATWTKNNIPPSIGRDKERIINGFSKLNSYDIEKYLSDVPTVNNIISEFKITDASFF